MAVLPVRTIPDPVLRQKAKPVSRILKRHRRLASDMIETMYASGGVGLAANQVGVLERIVVVDLGNARAMALVNPEIVEAEGREVDAEGCLSVPGKWGYVERAASIRVHAQDIKGHRQTVVASGYLARVLQHEIDHLDGILFIDRTSRVVEASQEGAL